MEPQWRRRFIYDLDSSIDGHGRRNKSRHDAFDLLYNIITRYLGCWCAALSSDGHHSASALESHFRVVYCIHVLCLWKDAQLFNVFHRFSFRSALRVKSFKLINLIKKEILYNRPIGLIDWSDFGKSNIILTYTTTIYDYI